MTVTSGDYFKAIEGAAIGHGWEVRARSTTALSFAVPTFRPTDNGCIALDVMPKGASPVAGPSGFTWFDLCDADLQLNNAVPVHCARLSMMTVDGQHSAVFGGISYNGAGPTNAYLMTAGHMRWSVSYDPGHFFPYETDTVTLGMDIRRILDVFLTGRGSLQDALAGIDTELDAFQVTVADQGAAIATLQTTVTDQAMTISALQATVAAHETRIANLETTSVAQATTNADFEARIAALEAA